MPALPTYQVRKFGPATSTIVLATKGGAVLGGIWISARGTSGKVTAYDNTASVAGTEILPVTSVPAVGKFFDGAPVEGGTGLTVKVASCTGTIFWRPGQAGGA